MGTTNQLVKHKNLDWIICNASSGDNLYEKYRLNGIILKIIFNSADLWYICVCVHTHTYFSTTTLCALLLYQEI